MRGANVSTRNVGKAASSSVVYDDMQVNIGRVRLGASAPTWRSYAFGIGGGVTYDILGFAVNNNVMFDVQTSHSMKLSTILDLHIHFTTPTDGTNTKFKFQLDVIAAPITGTWAVPTGSPFTVETTMAANYSTKHQLLEIADIPAVNTTVSTVYLFKLTRIAASANEYGDEVYISNIDCHYQKDTVGSLLETSKT